MGKREQQNKRPHEDSECGDDQQQHEQPMEVKIDSQNSAKSQDTNNNSGKSSSNKKNMKQIVVKEDLKQQQEYDEATNEEDDEDLDEEEEVEEEVEEEIEEDEEEDEEMEDVPSQKKSGSNQSGSQGANSGSGNNNSGNQSNNAGTDKRPRLTDELYEMNLRRKKEHVGSALYIPFPRKVTEEDVRAFVGQGPNIFLVGMQKLNAIVRYRTQTECEKQQKELAKKQFEGALLNIEPKTVKIDPANIDVKTLIIQYSNPDLTIMDFAQIFIKAISISLKGSKGKKESQEDLSFGSAIIIFPSHEEAREAFLATENLNIKGEQLRVVFADFRPPGPNTRGGSNTGSFNFRKSGGGGGGGGGGGDGGNRANFSRGGQGNRQGGGNFRRNRNSGGQRNFGNRNFNQNSGSYNQGGGRNYSPNKKFRSNR